MPNPYIRLASIALVLWLLSSFLCAQTKTRPSVWQPLRFFVGNWEGVGNGQPGDSKIERDYRFVLNDKFLLVQNKSTYAPQPKNPKGEVHQDWGIMSFDKIRKKFVFRQFHIESFVVQHVMTSIDDKTIIFTSESIENIPVGYRARETYKILGPDEFLEVFEMAEPGKEFEVYSESHFRRKK